MVTTTALGLAVSVAPLSDVRGPPVLQHAAADDTTGALQHACQALEAALKAIIVHEGQTVPTGQRGHDTRYLQSLANADLSAHTSIIDELTGVYDLARYVDTPDPGITDPQRVIREVDAVVMFAD